MEKGLPVVSVLSVENNKTTTPAPTHTPVSASTPALSLSQQPASSVIQTEPQEGWVAAGGGGGGGGGGGVPPPINAQPVQPPAAGATGSPTDTSSSYHNHQHHQHHIIIAPSLFSPFSSPFSHHHSLDIPLPQAPASALLPPRTTSTIIITLTITIIIIIITIIIIIIIIITILTSPLTRYPPSTGTSIGTSPSKNHKHHRRKEEHKDPRESLYPPFSGSTTHPIILLEVLSTHPVNTDCQCNLSIHSLNISSPSTHSLPLHPLH